MSHSNLHQLLHLFFPVGPKDGARAISQKKLLKVGELEGPGCFASRMADLGERLQTRKGKEERYQQPCGGV